MKHYLPGRLGELDDAELGSCILFNFQQKAVVGFMVEDPHQRRAILHVDAKDKEGHEHPALYAAEHFSREKIFIYEEARLVPIMAPEYVGYGYHGNGAISKALYLSDNKLILQASDRGHVARIDLTTGRAAQIDIAYSMHISSWGIEVPDGSGDYQVLAEFSA